MVHGRITRYNCSWFYLRRKHVCPNCKKYLERKKRECIVNSESKEAEKYDFSCGDLYLHGNIRFVTFYFECPNCKKLYEIDVLKKLERQIRKQQRSLKNSRASKEE